MKTSIEASPSEWEVLRVVWSLEKATSRAIAEILQNKEDWANATTKTLLGRLVKKGYLKTKKEGNRFIYTATVDEITGITCRLDDVVESLCAKSMGSAISHIINENPLSQKDIDMILKALHQKQATQDIQCTCLCRCDCGLKICNCHHKA